MNPERSSWRGRTIACLGIAAIAVVATLAIRGRRTLHLSWCAHRAATACLASGFDPRNPGPHWKALIESGAEGYPYIARVFRDPRSRVWPRAADTIEARHDRPGELLGYLRRVDPFAALRHAFVPPTSRKAVVSPADVLQADLLDFTGYGEWSGTAGLPLLPSPDGVEWLETIVLGRGLDDIAQASDPPAPPRELKGRALKALASMLGPGEVDRPGSEHARRIVRAIERAARGDPDPEVRLQANYCLLRRSRLVERLDPATLAFPSLAEWGDIASRVSSRLESCSRPPSDGRESGSVGTVDVETSEPQTRLLADSPALVALAYLDHHRTLSIVERLSANPLIGARLEALLEAPPALGSLPFPRWQTPREGVDRFRGGDAAERAAAARSVPDTSRE